MNRKIGYLELKNLQMHEIKNMQQVALIVFRKQFCMTSQVLTQTSAQVQLVVGETVTQLITYKSTITMPVHYLS